VVVTYHPDDEFPARLARMLAAVPRLVIVDNASNPPARQSLRALAADPRVALIENPENRGIAAALNQGIGRVRESGCRWVLLFDQDTEPFPDVIRTLAAARAAYRDPERVALVGSMPTDQHGARMLPPFPSGFRAVPYVITAGSLLSVDAFIAAGPFREDYYIDSVDREYGYRLRSAGYQVLLASDPGMTHVWGAPSRVAFGPFSFTCSFHSPLRRYYITRNWLLVFREYASRDPGSCAIDFFFMCLPDTAKALCLETDRWRKASAVGRGFLDAVRNRTGRTHPPWLEG
jgi:rhamnosyltransferase